MFVSSAWHWIDPDRAVPEIARVLRDGGRFGVIWTSRDRGSGWLREFDLARQQASADPDAGARPGHHEVALPEGSPFVRIETRSFAFSRSMTIDEFVDMYATYSRLITASPQDRAVELARARDAVRERFPRCRRDRRADALPVLARRSGRPGQRALAQDIRSAGPSVHQPGDGGEQDRGHQPVQAAAAVGQQREA